MENLNTTSYAILGLLNIRPWSAYELTQYMRVSYLRAIWPRAESRLYEAPKLLVKHGFAESEKQQVDSRERTVYTITDKGREALKIWLTQDAKRPVMEYEALLKVAYAEVGGVDTLRQWFDNIEEQAEGDLEQIKGAMQSLLVSMDEGTELNQGRMPVNLLVNAFILESIQMRLRWAEFAREFSQGWEQVGATDESLQQVKAWYDQTLLSLEKDKL